MGEMLISDILIALFGSLGVFTAGAIVGYIGKTHINRKISGWYEGKI